MVGYLLDTNVISELRRTQCGNPVFEWFHTIQDDELFLSTLIFGEIRYGVEKVRHAKPDLVKELELWQIQLLEIHGSRILPVTQEVADIWGHFMMIDTGNIDTGNTVDSLLAATAKSHGLTMVTRNIKHFSPYPINLLNPWTSALN